MLDLPTATWATVAALAIAAAVSLVRWWAGRKPKASHEYAEALKMLSEALKDGDPDRIAAASRRVRRAAERLL